MRQVSSQRIRAVPCNYTECWKDNKTLWMKWYAAIEHCIIILPEEGYKRAKEILQRNLGQTHVVTQAFLERVVSGPPIRNPDPEILSQLARDMEACLFGSTQLQHTSNLDSMDTLRKIVARLPIHLRAKWAESALSQTTPTFEHLIEFAQSRAAVASTYFGQIATQSRRPQEVTNLHPRAKLASQTTA
ncbi:uncharacterized protein [Montipora foliosa]|uniref:uncharacterized protein n=1 Tax=Montipora foliosa TaxID=591990 RepID=UPI0035F1BABB